MKKKSQNNDWYFFPKTFSIKEENPFADGSEHIPVRVLIHKNTGEIKLFAKSMAEKIGLDNLLKP